MEKPVILVRRARPGDADDIARLVVLSAEHFLPAIFGFGIPDALKNLAAGCGTLFSHEHAWIAEEQGATRGMLLGYSGAAKRIGDPRTGLALLGLLRADLIRRLPRLVRMQSTIGRMGKDAFYISNLAVYPEHRGKGIGSLLIAWVREEAAEIGAREVVLDVETDNPDAQRLYEKLGFRVKSETPPLVLEGRAFSFRRMGLLLARPETQPRLPHVPVLGAAPTSMS